MILMLIGSYSMEESETSLAMIVRVEIVQQIGQKRDSSSSMAVLTGPIRENSLVVSADTLRVRPASRDFQAAQVFLDLCITVQAGTLDHRQKTNDPDRHHQQDKPHQQEGY